MIAFQCFDTVGWDRLEGVWLVNVLRYC